MHLQFSGEICAPSHSKDPACSQQKWPLDHSLPDFSVVLEVLFPEACTASKMAEQERPLPCFKSLIFGNLFQQELVRWGEALLKAHLSTDYLCVSWSWLCELGHLLKPRTH